MSARTPAPWISGLIFNPKSERPNVIIWSGTTPTSMGTAVARDVAAADAPLICAAPDLLEVLEDAPERSTYYGPDGFEFDRFEADYDHWLDDRRATLAKVGGKP